ncbi:MAG: 4-diphosphocytidyl-2-C-methyl-D-erythritol kinase [Candidatus Binatia bacterium]|nr:MAG: 4-diphosphocytidyl-2-C-methyl-D-erythritol kinase [Candidatus Binatia bacterium]
MALFHADVRPRMVRERKTPSRITARGGRIVTLAPAKVNFCLHVLRRRPDGYHDIESLAAPISLYDRIEIRPTPGKKIRIFPDPEGSVPQGPENLAWKAASALFERFGTSFGLDIAIRKRIPVGAGLGGGSSDAAAVLLAVLRLLGTSMRAEELHGLATRLGADVPFFLVGRPAVMRGIGERIEPFPGFRRRWLVLAWPGFSVSTAWAYRLFDVSLTKTRHPHKISRLSGTRGPAREVLSNDLEAVVVSVHPEVVRLKEELLRLGAGGAAMTGSGPAVFGLFENKGAAQEAARRLRKRGVWARAVHTLGSPRGGR